MIALLKVRLFELINFIYVLLECCLTLLRQLFDIRSFYSFSNKVKCSYEKF